MLSVTSWKEISYKTQLTHCDLCMVYPNEIVQFIHRKFWLLWEYLSCGQIFVIIDSRNGLVPSLCQAITCSNVDYKGLRASQIYPNENPLRILRISMTKCKWLFNAGLIELITTILDSLLHDLSAALNKTAAIYKLNTDFQWTRFSYVYTRLWYKWFSFNISVTVIH